MNQSTSALVDTFSSPRYAEPKAFRDLHDNYASRAPANWDIFGVWPSFQPAEYDLGGRSEAFPQGFARGIVRLDSDYAESPAFAQPEFFRRTKP